MDILFCDFSGVYYDYDMEDFGGKRTDLSHIPGTDMYCSPEAEGLIRELILPHGWRGIHFIDSGNYHYMTKLFTDMSEEDFDLLLIDNHTDMQPPVLGRLLSCGGWALDVLGENRHIGRLILIGPPESDIKLAEEELALRGMQGRVDSIGREELDKDIFFAKLENMLSVGDGSHTPPLYISIDKDVLSREYVVTNWDQGIMSRDLLGEILGIVTARRDIMGADISGEDTALKNQEDILKNKKINRYILERLLC